MRPIKPAARKESVDERSTSAEWRDLGYIELKIMQANHDGWPDRWYRGLAMSHGFWCEWKRVGEEPEPHQLLRHGELRAQGEIVIVAHSRREFWEKVRVLQKADKL